ncbi:MAG: FecR domain-containing protein, partial [Pseudomonas sp.]|nr:FecR domain-containing protein [Pseudomonas sp.]
MNVSSQVAEQAVHWLLEMQQGTLNPRQQAAWQQWLNAHSEHQRAWEQIQSVNQRLRGVPSPLAHAALNAPTSRSRRQALKLLLIVGAGSAAAWSLRQQHILPPLTADYRSPVGQRRTVQLADGSQLQLNTGSAVDVHFDGQQRLVRLLEGEILLTARAGQAPLHVLTGQGLLSSQAARLTVRQFNDHTQLAVLAGQVEVMPNRYNGLALRVDAAQQVNFTRKGWDTPRPTDANSGAWADGMLVAAHMRL